MKTNNNNNEYNLIMSYQQDKRTLIKQGRMSKLPIKRFYIIKNEYMVYYKSQMSPKPKGLISLL